MPSLKLTPWHEDPGINETIQALIWAVKDKYGLNRTYVTVEDPTNQLLRNLAARYKVASASYAEMTSGEGPLDAAELKFKHLIIRDRRLDAFFFDLHSAGSYGREVLLIFFDKPREIEKFRREIQENPQPVYKPGIYSYHEGSFGPYLAPLDVSGGEKPILEPGLMENLQHDTVTFFNSGEFYKANNIPHKRGILFLGHPGVGKTTFNKHYLSLIDPRRPNAAYPNMYGIVIDCSKAYFGPEMFHFFAAAVGNAPKVLVMEDVDGATQSYGSRSAFLNFLDGPKELQNTLVIATTNYPERLDDAILERPSRFDALYYMGLPSLPLRKEFLLRWFPHLSGEPDRLEALAAGTEGFTGAYFKELFTLTGLREGSIENALVIIKERQALIRQFRSGMPSLTDGSMPDIIYTMNEESEPMYADLKASADLAMNLDHSIEPEFLSKIVASARE